MINNRQRIEIFSKDITDFMVLHASAQLGIGKDVMLPESLHDRWKQLTEDYKSIPNKSASTKDIWKQLSAIMSNHFLSEKVIKAEQAVFSLT